MWLSCWRRTKNFNYGNTHFLYPFKHSLMIKMDVSFKYGSTFCFILLSDKGYVNFSNSHFECILCGLMIELVGYYRHQHHSLHRKRINHLQKIDDINHWKSALLLCTTPFYDTPITTSIYWKNSINIKYHWAFFCVFNNVRIK